MGTKRKIKNINKLLLYKSLGLSVNDLRNKYKCSSSGIHYQLNNPSIRVISFALKESITNDRIKQIHKEVTNTYSSDISDK